MPNYEYVCDSCGFSLEKLQVLGGEPVSCHNCEKEMRRKVSGSVMVKMKGEGGYPSRRKQVFNTTMRNHPKLG